MHSPNYERNSTAVNQPTTRDFEPQDVTPTVGDKIDLSVSPDDLETGGNNKSGNWTIIPHKKDIVVGVDKKKHVGNKEFMKSVETTYEALAGMTYNRIVYKALLDEIEEGGRVLVPQENGNGQVDLGLKARESTKVERVDFFRTCYNMVVERRALIPPPEPKDICIGDFAHPGTQGFVAIVQQAAVHFQNAAYSKTIHNHIVNQVEAENQRVMVLPNPMVPWRIATPKERKGFTRGIYSGDISVAQIQPKAVTYAATGKVATEAPEEAARTTAIANAVVRVAPPNVEEPLNNVEQGISQAQHQQASSSSKPCVMPYGGRSITPLVISIIAYIFFLEPAFSCKTFSIEFADSYGEETYYYGYRGVYYEGTCFPYADEEVDEEIPLKVGRAVGAAGAGVGAVIVVTLGFAQCVPISRGVLTSVGILGGIAMASSSSTVSSLGLMVSTCLEGSEGDDYYYDDYYSSNSFNLCLPNIPAYLGGVSWLFWIVGTSIMCCCMGTPTRPTSATEESTNNYNNQQNNNGGRP